MALGPYRSFSNAEPVLAFDGGLGAASARDRVCRPARLARGGGGVGGVVGDRGRWGSGVTRPDAEPTQNVVRFAPSPTPESPRGGVGGGLLSGQSLKSNRTRRRDEKVYFYLGGGWEGWRRRRQGGAAS